jgi:hypothetical protein
MATQRRLGEDGDMCEERELDGAAGLGEVDERRKRVEAGQ